MATSILTKTKDGNFQIIPANNLSFKSDIRNGVIICSQGIGFNNPVTLLDLNDRLSHLTIKGREEIMRKFLYKLMGSIDKSKGMLVIETIKDSKTIWFRDNINNNLITINKFTEIESVNNNLFTHTYTPKYEK